MNNCTHAHAHTILYHKFRPVFFFNFINLAHKIILQEFTLYFFEDTMGKSFDHSYYKPSINYKKKGSLKSMYKQ